MIFNSLTV